jgi:hypothetical protein
MSRVGRLLVLSGIGLGVAATAALAVLLVAESGGNGSRSGSQRVASHGRPVATARAEGTSRSSQPTADQPTRTCASATWSPGRSGSFAAVVRRVAVIRSRPSGGTILARVPRLDRNRLPNVLAILGARGNGCRPAWYRVQFSNSGNGSSGWVGSWLVVSFRVDTRILVQLSERRLVMYRSGRRAISARIGVGAARTPTPVGRFFVTERWRILDPTGPLGPAVLGISAHSPALRDWAQGGPVALHGTNEPGSIGQAASHGCIRVDNAVIRQLLTYALLGTPVVIRS